MDKRNTGGNPSVSLRDLRSYGEHGFCTGISFDVQRARRCILGAPAWQDTLLRTLWSEPNSGEIGQGDIVPSLPRRWMKSEKSWDVVPGGAFRLELVGENVALPLASTPAGRSTIEYLCDETRSVGIGWIENTLPSQLTEDRRRAAVARAWP